MARVDRQIGSHAILERSAAVWRITRSRPPQPTCTCVKSPRKIERAHRDRPDIEIAAAGRRGAGAADEPCAQTSWVGPARAQRACRARCCHHPPPGRPLVRLLQDRGARNVRAGSGWRLPDEIQGDAKRSAQITVDLPGDPPCSTLGRAMTMISSDMASASSRPRVACTDKPWPAHRDAAGNSRNSIRHLRAKLRIQVG